ncbi:putative lipid II flippase FtsW [Jeotgalibacillus salarius]|uniref:Putative lipid II flippase FtsW n=1 Tax=Jeotgalibacillus salarius TaxID=546023 RepID=A0A4Y8LD57_9BACL|nr:putative lipid II flippase FtsW [Jeotgalibacillus salarius]TFE00232.1 putative lipid II flippase FtsW [Jeotgalibacillus salarius]
MDRLLFSFVLICSIFGVVLIDSASSVWAFDRFGDAHFFSKRQAVYLAAGLVAMMIISKLDYLFWYRHAKLIYIFSALLLVLVLIPGIGLERNGSQSWIGVGPISIQPAELAKAGVLMMTAALISRSTRKLTMKKMILLMSVVLMPFGIVMLQPDLGTGTVLAGSGLSLLFLAGVSIRFFLFLFGAGITGFAALVIAAPYRMQRIYSFIDPWQDPLGAGFQIIQSLYAAGPGGLFGAGFFDSRQKHFYLPEPQNDFIFAIAAEEMGLAGSVIIVLLFSSVIWRGILIALGAPDVFSKMLAGGIVISLGLQAVINISVVIGLIPVTGITLPFFSYGGSSLMVVLCMCGILLNISRHSRI